MILAIDQATTSAICFGLAGCARPEWRIIRVKSDLPGEALSRFRYWLASALDAVKPTIVVRENTYFPRSGGVMPVNIKTLSRLYAFAETIDAFCYELRIPCHEVTPAAVTSAFLGKVPKMQRAAKKAAYIARCAQFGWTVESEDVADAIGIWCATERQIDPEAAARRRAAAGDDLALTGGAAVPSKRRRPASANRRPPDRTRRTEIVDAAEISLFNRELQPEPR